MMGRRQLPPPTGPRCDGCGEIVAIDRWGHFTHARGIYCAGGFIDSGIAQVAGQQYGYRFTDAPVKVA